MFCYVMFCNVMFYSQFLAPSAQLLYYIQIQLFSQLLHLQRLFYTMPGPEFFCACRGGDQNFFCACRGRDQKKLAIRDHKQTPPPPGKKWYRPKGGADFYIQSKSEVGINPRVANRVGHKFQCKQIEGARLSRGGHNFSASGFRICTSPPPNPHP